MTGAKLCTDLLTIYDQKAFGSLFCTRLVAILSYETIEQSQMDADHSLIFVDLKVWQFFVESGTHKLFIYTNISFGSSCNLLKCFACSLPLTVFFFSFHCF